VTLSCRRKPIGLLPKVECTCDKKPCRCLIINFIPYKYRKCGIPTGDAKRKPEHGGEYIWK
jgi:hypothetical protein